MTGVETRSGDAKRALRSELIAVRARLSQEERSEKSHAIAERVDRIAAVRDARTVALYAPLGTEVDSTELARRIGARGGRVVYPRSVVGERRLVFCRCDPAELVRGPLGAREPPAGAPEVALAEVDCVVMPGVAFSLDGLRLGRGGGYYDATLWAMPGSARVGVAFDVQVVPSLPREPHDAPLDALVTESRALTFARGAR
ncbi:5-formyltetrahydrofolate cyclo-ligase [Anaeromyxobacter oryzae]|uniref:5-formyltetrahydrofolate cyclo-ligase n=1 Tax=Anaeromyxobacter oryzae TaxID=2918170 RepID=A0ABN6MUZ7_9BACT|nr:5-formyltetrahydrofolate cyclo-ligase [Anaeromyxobacter oryzae]BDG04812.1 5-formyltetrahydrofolate cyclo-ligase [Anaeromyxobacter oryzae]